jgi:hypothetical protein
MLAAVMAGVATLLAGCSMFPDVHTYRYRLTVEVETPKGIRSGSSVIESSASESKGLNGSQVHSELHGEAVAIDMPDGGTLFALLDAGEGTAPFAAAAYREILPKSVIIENSGWKVEHDAIEHQTVAADVPPKYYPIFVRFTDIKDPASVVKVDPAHLERDYGAGVRLKRVFVQITDDDVTTGIEKRFSWWTQFRNLHLDGSPARYEDMTKQNLTAHMSPGRFSTEYNK